MAKLDLVDGQISDDVMEIFEAALAVPDDGEWHPAPGDGEILITCATDTNLAFTYRGADGSESKGTMEKIRPN